MTDEPNPEIKAIDPLSIGITAITAFESMTGAAIGFEAAAGVGQFIIGAAILGGLAATSFLNKPNQGGATAGVTAQDNKISTRQSTPPKKVIYGSALVGGALFLEKVIPPYLYHGYAIAEGEISGFRKLNIGTTEVSIYTVGDYLPTNAILTPAGAMVSGEITATPNYATYLRASLRTGSPDQIVDPLIYDGIPAVGDNFRQRGVATAVLRYQHPGDYASFQAVWGSVQYPSAFFLVDGLPIPDPRDPSQIVEYDPNDPAAVAVAKATWKFSNNASLVQTHYLTQWYGGRIDPRRIKWEKVAEAADYDDELVATTGGDYIKRHTIDGVITLNQQPSETMRALLTANRGFVIDSGKNMWVTSSKPRDPVFTIYDAIQTGGIEFQALKPKREVFNRILTRFTANDREYNLADGPILDRTDLRALDGEQLDATLQLPYTLDYRRVERLQKAYLDTSRLGKQITCHVDLKLLDELDDEIIGSVANFSSDLLPNTNGKYLVTQVGLAESFSSIELLLTEYDKNIETDWNYAVDEVPFSLDSFIIDFRFDFSDRVDSGYLALM